MRKGYLQYHRGEQRRLGRACAFAQSSRNLHCSLTNYREPKEATDKELHLSRNMTKPRKWLCAQRRLRSTWASAQSDQILRCPHQESFGPKLLIERTAKTLIRLGESPA